MNNYIKRVTKHKRTIGKPIWHVHKNAINKTNMLQRLYQWLMSVDYDTGTFIEGKEDKMTLDDWIPYRKDKPLMLAVIFSLLYIIVYIAQLTYFIL